LTQTPQIPAKSTARIRIVLPDQSDNSGFFTDDKSNRKTKRDCDFVLYRERNLIEYFFNKIKHFRAIATRCDKLARNFLAAVQLEQLPIRLTISRICQVCGAFSFGDLIETRGDALAEASDSESAILERI